MSTRRYPTLGARILMNMIEDDSAPWCVEHGPCWLWTLACSDAGYGRITVRVAGRPYGFWVHRVAYELFTGKIVPDGLTLDHQCERKHCFRPDHLEIVSRPENTRRQHTRAKAYDRLIQQTAVAVSSVPAMLRDGRRIASHERA